MCQEFNHYVKRHAVATHAYKAVKRLGKDMFCSTYMGTRYPRDTIVKATGLNRDSLENFEIRDVIYGGAIHVYPNLEDALNEYLYWGGGFIVVRVAVDGYVASGRSGNVITACYERIIIEAIVR